MLRTLRPLVWQPAITPMMPGGIGTPVFPVNMVGSRAQQRVPVAFESSKTEVMARAISWRLWAVFHEWIGIAQDMWRAPWKHKLSYLLREPGWTHDGSRETSDQIRERWLERRGAEEKSVSYENRIASEAEAA